MQVQQPLVLNFIPWHLWNSRQNKINYSIRKHKIVFLVEWIHFITVCTPCTSTRYTRLVSLLTRKPIKCQVHKHAPADLYCSTSGNWGKWPCMVMGCHPEAVSVGGAQPQQPAPRSRRRVKDEGRTAGKSVLSLSDDKQCAHQKSCSQAAQLPLHLI